MPPGGQAAPWTLKEGRHRRAAPVNVQRRNGDRQRMGAEKMAPQDWWLDVKKRVLLMLVSTC